MKPTLQLKIGQHLTMTPQLQQAIRLLQLSSLDLQAEVQEALDSNPLLDTDDSPETSSEAETESATNTDQPEKNKETSNLDDQIIDFSKNDSPQETTELHSKSKEDASVDLNETNDFPEDIPVDSNWDDLYQGISTSSSGSGGGEDDDYDMEGRNSAQETLYDQLIWQLNLTTMSELDQAIALSIIEAIDERGYLTISVEEIRLSLLAQKDIIDDIFKLQAQELAELGLNPDVLYGNDEDGEDNDFNQNSIAIAEVEAVLKRIQQFDPPGVAARDLKECLLIQLKQLENDTPYREEALKVVGQYLDQLGSRDFNTIMRKAKLSETALKEAIKLIQTLTPYPGSSIDSEKTEYVIPDVIVRKHKGRWMVELNPDAAPKLRINQNYASMIQRADNSSDNTFLKNNLQEARWFIKSLLSRNETLLKVSTKIVEHQVEFFEEGEESMKPLVLHDIAEAVEMHESTISRVTTQKYMHTPRGIFELKYFFSSHVSTSTGGECSSTAIRAIIKKLIAAENPKKPLSDSKLANLLADQDIKVARRTIAKYREAMNIPPSNERKRLV